MKKILVVLALIFSVNSSFAGGGENIHLIYKKWPFEGAFGKFDRQSIQRGYQVYKEVCAACHSLNRVYYRNLLDIGFSEAEVKAIAAEYTVIDGPDEAGDMFERPAKPSDKYVPPYPNENAARASNGGAYPVDLSLIVKARPNGANYVYSLLNGYEEAPSTMKIPAGMYYNRYFSGHQIAMPNPLSNDLVEYMDGTKASVAQMSSDVVNFLQWAAEPEMEHRNQMGIKVLIFLMVMTLLFYIAKKRIWSDVE